MIPSRGHIGLRRPARAAWALAAAAVFFGSASGMPQAQAQPSPAPGKSPNFVIIVADDLGWGDLGCYGNGRIKTPNIDRLASQGTRFTQYYVNSPVCTPTRAALLTGRFPSRDSLHGHLDTTAKNRERGMPDQLDPAVPTLAKDLKKAGYVTGHFGKWHISNPGGPDPHQYGFDEWNIDRQPGQNLWDASVRARSSESIVDRTIEFVRKHRNERFFVNTWLLDVHATLYPTDEQLKPFRGLVASDVRFTSPEQVYFAAAADADKHVGRLMQALDELGLAENTIVVFSSDNGPEDASIRSVAHSAAGSAGPFRGRKRSL